MGIDLSPRNTGIVILSEEGVFLRSMTVKYVIARTKRSEAPITEEQRIVRMCEIANSIVGICTTWKIRRVGIEGFSMRSRFQAHQIGEVAGVVKSQLFLQLGLVPFMSPPSAGRKHVTGHGKMEKEQIVEVVRNGLGYDVANDHEADAGIVARYTFDISVAEEKETARE